MKLRLKQIGPRMVEVVSDKWSFVVDLREQFGGENAGPNPSELAVAAVASCEVLTGVYWASRRHNIELRDLEADVAWQYEQKPDRISRISVVIRNVGDQLADEKKTRAFKGIAKGCTVTRTLQTQPELYLEVS
ncbi:MAG: OsmC family protein [Deltaproteobacteria bacterium]